MRDLLGSADDSDEPAALVAGELAQRLQQLEAGARTLRAECRENAKTLDAAEAELVKQVTARSPAPPPSFASYGRIDVYVRYFADGGQRRAVGRVGRVRARRGRGRRRAARARTRHRRPGGLLPGGESALACCTQTIP